MKQCKLVIQQWWLDLLELVNQWLLKAYNIP
jgi:hypothetical protein